MTEEVALARRKVLNYELHAPLNRLLFPTIIVGQDSSAYDTKLSYRELSMRLLPAASLVRSDLCGSGIAFRSARDVEEVTTTASCLDG